MCTRHCWVNHGEELGYKRCFLNNLERVVAKPEFPLCKLDRKRLERQFLVTIRGLDYGRVEYDVKFAIEDGQSSNLFSRRVARRDASV